MLRSFSCLLFPSVLLLLVASPIGAQSSSYRGLWVGEVSLNQVNEVTVGLDADNVPRAPDPNVPTPTSDLARLRLILHVDGAGNVSLLKQVAILAKKAGSQDSESDLALVTDPRLYGSFPAQPAKRISSVAFDFGDAKATGAVNEIAERAATAAAAAAQLNGATVATVTLAAENAAATVIAEADAASDYFDFLQEHMTAAKVRLIATAGPTTAQSDAASNLFNNSFYQDTRGIRMIEEIEGAVAALPGDATDAQKEQLALNVASSFEETDRGYDRFLSSEIFGDMIINAAEAGALAADGVAPVQIDTFEGGAGTEVRSVAHGLVNNDEVAIFGAAIGAYNGVHDVIKIDDDIFQIDVSFVVGGPIDGYAAHDRISPTIIETPDHGLSDGDRITLRDSSLADFNGKHLVSVIDANRFSIDVVFDSDPAVRGKWAIRSGAITGYVGTGDGSAGVAVTAPSHGLNNGDRVEIQGSGESSYNGLRIITRIDDNSFSITNAFGGDPEVKGRWDLPRPIAAFRPPSVVPTLVSATAHGLSSGDRVAISGSDNASYNVEHVVTVVNADSFSIGIAFDAATGDPGVKGSWVPGSGGSWRNAATVRTAVETAAAPASAEAIDVKVSTSDTRAPDAVDIVIEAIVERAAMEGTTLAVQGTYAAAEAGFDALASDVPRFPNPPSVPSLDYNDFIETETFTESVATAAVAAANAAVKESTNVIATPESIQRRALDAAIDGIVTTFSAASRALLTELPMSGSFGPGETNLTGEILLPANHPTNPFRHRRHPDHARGFDVNRTVRLSFFSEDNQPQTRGSYGVDHISGVYDEEIFGLHKPLGPDKDIGLKVRGNFQLQRISLIDALNGR